MISCTDRNSRLAIFKNINVVQVPPVDTAVCTSNMDYLNAKDVWPCFYHFLHTKVNPTTDCTTIQASCGYHSTRLNPARRHCYCSTYYYDIIVSYWLWYTTVDIINSRKRIPNPNGMSWSISSREYNLYYYCAHQQPVFIEGELTILYNETTEIDQVCTVHTWRSAKAISWSKRTASWPPSMLAQRTKGMS